MPTIVLDLDSTGAVKGLKQYEQEVNKAAKATDKLTALRGKITSVGAAFAQLAAQAITAASAAIVTFGGFALRAAANLEETTGAFEQTYSASLKLAETLAGELNQSFALTEQQAKQAMTSFGVMAKNMGFAEQTAAIFSSEMSKLAVDLSAFANIPVNDALQAMKSGFMGNYEALDKLYINLNSTMVAEEAMRLGLIKTKTELDNKSRMLATASLLEQMSADAIGQHAREQDSFNGLLKEARKLWGDFTAMMGEYILPYATQFLEILVQWGSNQQNVNRVIVGTVSAVQFLHNGMKGLELAAKGLIKAFSATFKFIVDGFMTITKFHRAVIDQLIALGVTGLEPLARKKCGRTFRRNH